MMNHTHTNIQKNTSLFRFQDQWEWLLFDRGLDYVEFLSHTCHRPLTTWETQFIIKVNDVETHEHKVYNAFCTILNIYKRRLIWNNAIGDCNGTQWDEESKLDMIVQVKDDFISMIIEQSEWKMRASLIGAEDDLVYHDARTPIASARTPASATPASARTLSLSNLMSNALRYFFFLFWFFFEGGGEE